MTKKTYIDAQTLSKRLSDIVLKCPDCRIQTKFSFGIYVDVDVVKIGVSEGKVSLKDFIKYFDSVTKSRPFVKVQMSLLGNEIMLTEENFDVFFHQLEQEPQNDKDIAELSNFELIKKVSKNLDDLTKVVEELKNNQKCSNNTYQTYSKNTLHHLLMSSELTLVDGKNPYVKLSDNKGKVELTVIFPDGLTTTFDALQTIDLVNGEAVIHSNNDAPFHFKFVRSDKTA